MKHRRSDGMRMTFLAEKLDEMRKVILERTNWDEGHTVEIDGPHPVGTIGSSEPCGDTVDALRQAIDNAMDEEANDQRGEQG